MLESKEKNRMKYYDTSFHSNMTRGKNATFLLEFQWMAKVSIFNCVSMALPFHFFFLSLSRNTSFMCQFFFFFSLHVSINSETGWSFLVTIFNQIIHEFFVACKVHFNREKFNRKKPTKLNEKDIVKNASILWMS